MMKNKIEIKFKRGTAVIEGILSVEGSEEGVYYRRISRTHDGESRYGLIEKDWVTEFSTENIPKKIRQKLDM